VNADELRERGEAFSEEIGREGYEAGAGLRAQTRYAAIFARYPDLVSPEAWEAAQGTRALREWALDMRVGRAVAELDDRLHAWEATALVVPPEGEGIPYQRAGIAIANETRRDRRLALDRARLAILAEPAALRGERLTRERTLLAGQLGTDDVVAARSDLSGMPLDALSSQCEGFLSRTADLYRDALGERLARDLQIAPGDAQRSDAAYLFRGAAHDEWFGAVELVPTARRQVGDLGLDAVAGGRIVYDTGDRERKRARAFCAPVRVPDEVYLVIRPHGGFPDWQAFWHELGHALHFANASRALLFEQRWLGDNSVTECYAMLFEHMITTPAWLRRYARMGGAVLERFLREQAFALLAMVRRYAAKLRYEIALHRAPSLEAGAARYAELLTEATGFRYEPGDALLDLDDGFYSARYLRAWQLEATLRAAMVERFDEDWFRNPRSGPFLLDLLSRGQREDAVALAASALGARLSFDPLVSSCEAALA
jgi:hypothetical protein